MWGNTMKITDMLGNGNSAHKMTGTGDTVIDPSEYTITINLADSNAHVAKALVVTLSSANTSLSSVDVSLTQYGDVYTTTTEIFEISAVPGDATEAHAGSFTNNVSVGVVLNSNTTQAGTINATRQDTLADETTTTALTSTVSRIGRWDGLTRSSRKVISLHSYDESSSDSLNTLFTIEQTLAQQTYFSYAMGNYGFDLISWYILKQWLETRSKMLSTKLYFTFDDRTQFMRLIPEPKTGGNDFYGVVSCYVEKPIVDLIVEPSSPIKTDFTCLSPTTFPLIVFKFLIINLGSGLPEPKGCRRAILL